MTHKTGISTLDEHIEATNNYYRTHEAYEDGVATPEELEQATKQLRNADDALDAWLNQ